MSFIRSTYPYKPLRRILSNEICYSFRVTEIYRYRYIHYSSKLYGEELRKSRNEKSEQNNRFHELYKNSNSYTNAKDPKMSVNKYNKAGGGRKEKDKPRKPYPEKRTQQKRSLKFHITTGTDQARSAIKHLIMKIYSIRNSYDVKFVDENNRMVVKHLANIVNSLDLSQHGIFFVPPSNATDLPIVKMNKSFEMIKSYSNDLAIEKEKELLEKGSVIAKKVIKQRDRSAKKKSATKILTLSWKISIGDLKNQKMAEIKKRLEKGEKFLIYLGDKRSLYSARKNVDKAEGILNGNNVELNLEAYDFTNLDPEISIELKRRIMIVTELQNSLLEENANIELSGDIDSRVVISCSSLVKAGAVGASEQDPSIELRKQKKVTNRNNHASPTKKISKEEDLDALYSFKIED